jgi:hypothetical protein
MQEKWTLWQPITNLSKHYYLESCSTTNEQGLEIIITDDSDKKFSIALPGYICSYRITNESFTMKTLVFLENMYGKEFYTQNAFFTIENSEYLGWMKNQVNPIAFEYHKFKHYCIFTSNEIIDIISNYKPEVKYIK